MVRFEILFELKIKFFKIHKSVCSEAYKHKGKLLEDHV